MSIRHTLFRAPLPSLLAILALALGLGAASSLGSLLDRLVLHASPYAEASRLVSVWRTSPEFDDGQFNAYHFEQLAAAQSPFEALGAVSLGGANLEGTDGLRPVDCMRASGRLLPLLKVQPALGRLFFTPEEDRLGGPGAVILSHGLWRSRFGGDPALLGHSLLISGRDRTVVGVLPADFEAPTPRVGRPQIILPIGFREEEREPKAGVDYEVVGRLRPGVGVENANQWVRAFAQGQKAGPQSLRVAPLADTKAQPYRERLRLLVGAVGLMLLVACANAGGLLLARQAERQGVLILQGVLGASPSRLAAQVAAEGLGFGLLGALGGLALEAPLRLFLASQLGLATPPPRPLWVWGASPLLGLAAGLAASVLPAWWAARIQPAQALRGLDRKASPRARSRQALVAAELALSFILLAASSLLLRTLWGQLRRGPGFETKSLHVASVVSPQASAASPNWPLLANVLADLPGVDAAVVGNPVPIWNAGGWGSTHAEGQERLAKTWHHRMEGPVAKTFGMRLLEGRDLKAGEREGVLVSEPLAKALWPEASALGHQISAIGGFKTVVGVVSGSREHGLDEPIRPQIFQSIPPEGLHGGLSLMIRSSSDAATLEAQVRAALRGVDARLAMGPLCSFDSALDTATSNLRRAALPLTALAGVSAILAALGTVGLLSQHFRQRRREWGIRAALGAGPSRLAGQVFWKGARLLSAGLATGLLGAVAFGCLLQHQIPGLVSLDLMALITATLLLSAATLLASLQPALRAARLHPAEALRSE